MELNQLAFLIVVVLAALVHRGTARSTWKTLHNLESFYAGSWGSPGLNISAADDVVFKLYWNKRNSSIFEPLKYSRTDPWGWNMIARSKFTKIIVPDYNYDFFKTDFAETTKNAYLQNPLDQNIIIMDWTTLPTWNCSFGELLHGTSEEGFCSSASYRRAAGSIWIAGGRLGELLVWIRNLNVLDLNRVHIIGMGAGSHIAGRAGALVLKTFGEPVKRITALNAVGPTYYGGCKENSFPERYLQATDAGFVDAYHTHDSIGFNRSIGMSDVWLEPSLFYSFCGLGWHLAFSWRHSMAGYFWAQTIGTTGFARDEDEALCANSEYDLSRFPSSTVPNCEKKIRVGEYATLKTATYGPSYVRYIRELPSDGVGDDEGTLTNFNLKALRLIKSFKLNFRKLLTPATQQYSSHKDSSNTSDWGFDENFYGL